MCLGTELSLIYEEIFLFSPSAKLLSGSGAIKSTLVEGMNGGACVSDPRMRCNAAF